MSILTRTPGARVRVLPKPDSTQLLAAAEARWRAELAKETTLRVQAEAECAAAKQQLLDAAADIEAGASARARLVELQAELDAANSRVEELTGERPSPELARTQAAALAAANERAAAAEATAETLRLQLQRKAVDDAQLRQALEAANRASEAASAMAAAEAHPETPAPDFDLIFHRSTDGLLRKITIKEGA